MLTDEIYRQLIGNFFLPSALKAAFGFGTNYSLANFLNSDITCFQACHPISPEDIAIAFDELLVTATADVTKHIEVSESDARHKTTLHNQAKSSVR